ncbi:porin family protein [Rhodocytophaga aerolata]|uniref:porin family protein n=1 Tax=Rhodocytophaga aerolata TaxID=455078 RepID=UPI00361A1A77
MKNTLLGTLFFVFTFALSLPGFSQVSWGIQGGGNVSNFHSRPGVYRSTHNRLGYHGGLFAEISLGKKVFFQPSLLYSLKGWRSRPELDGGHQGRVRFDYIDIPLLVGYRLSDKLSLLAGPQVGELIRATSIIGRDLNFDVSSQFKKIDAGIVGAVSYKFTPRLGMQVSYSLGLRRLNQVSFRKGDGSWSTPPTGNNRVLGVSAYYLLKTKR